MTIASIIVASIGAIAAAVAALAGLRAVSEAKKTVTLGKESLSNLLSARLSMSDDIVSGSLW